MMNKSGFIINQSMEEYKEQTDEVKQVKNQLNQYKITTVQKRMTIIR